MRAERAPLRANPMKNKEEQIYFSMRLGNYTFQLCLMRINFFQHVTGFKQVMNSLKWNQRQGWHPCILHPYISPKIDSYLPEVRGDGGGEQDEAHVDFPAGSCKRSPFTSRDLNVWQGKRRKAAYSLHSYTVRHKTWHPKESAGFTDPKSLFIFLVNLHTRVQLTFCGQGHPAPRTEPALHVSPSALPLEAPIHMLLPSSHCGRGSSD